MPDFSANEKSLLLINSPNMDKMKGIPNNPKIPIPTYPKTCDNNSPYG